MRLLGGLLRGWLVTHHAVAGSSLWLLALFLSCVVPTVTLENPLGVRYSGLPVYALAPCLAASGLALTLQHDPPLRPVRRLGVPRTLWGMAMLLASVAACGPLLWSLPGPLNLLGDWLVLLALTALTATVWGLLAAWMMVGAVLFVHLLVPAAAVEPAAFLLNDMIPLGWVGLLAAVIAVGLYASIGAPGERRLTVA